MNWKEYIPQIVVAVIQLIVLCIQISMLFNKNGMEKQEVQEVVKCIREDQLGLLIKYLSLTITAFNTCIQ